MENRDDREFRELLGKKLAEAMKEDDFADLEDLIDMPSRETFNQWIEAAEERRYKKFKHHKLYRVCAIAVVLLVCVAVVMKCVATSLPEYTADPKDDVDIEATMETSTEYKSWSEVPQDIKDQFVEFKELPDGYQVESVVVEKTTESIKVTYILVNEEGEEIRIREFYAKKDTLKGSIVSTENKVMVSNGGRNLRRENRKRC